MANTAAPSLKKFSIALAIVVILIVAGVVWWTLSLQPVNPSNKNTRSFVVAKGDGVREIAKKLKENDLIKDQIAFFLLIKKLGIEKDIQAGSFKISPSMSAEEVAKKLTLGTEDIWLTIPEGWRSEQIIQYLQENGVTGEPGKWSEEGKYFPDTYLVPKTISFEQIRQIMRQNFDAKVNFPVTEEQLIIASMVEREAKHDSDRPLIASVILNRLGIGMKLDIDATIQYALGFWKKELTLEDLKIKSPYNTYTNTGLPPTSICNPGLAVIRAVVNPAQTDYLYYLSDESGTTHYAKTLQEHNANVAKYLGS